MQVAVSQLVTMGPHPFPWHLRTLGGRKNSFFVGNHDEPAKKLGASLSSGGITHGAPMTASQIFATVDPKNPEKRKGIIDGMEVEFELKEDVTQKPTTDRVERMEWKVHNVNNLKSSWEDRARMWLLSFSICTMSLYYLASFVLLNVVFAGLWYIEDGRCCDDPTLTFREVFDFAVQTSTTIGYGGYVPEGYFANFLVVIISFLALALNTVYAGLLFAKFVTPLANIQFSEIMCLSNMNGIPCLEVRIGNTDGCANVLTDLSVRMSYSYAMSYIDEKGNEQDFFQTQTLKLLQDKRHKLREVWTLRHVVDETSPLFGLDLLSFPGNSIIDFSLSVIATQQLSKASVSMSTGYMLEDVVIGHRFEDQVKLDWETRTSTIDYAKMNETVPHPVWHPTKRAEVGSTSN